MHRTPNIVVAVVYLLGRLNAFDEPVNDKVDKFTYEEQLLQKLVRMELKMELMDKAMSQVQDRVTNALQNLTSEVDEKAQELVKLKGSISVPLVAFSAYGIKDSSLDNNQILILQSTYLNEGDGYDTMVGIFTAPVAGLYMFSVHICQVAGRQFSYHLMMDNTVIAKSTKFNNVQHDCASMTTITKLAVYQRVWVKSSYGNTNNQLYDDSYRQTSFTGILLHL